MRLEFEHNSSAVPFVEKEVVSQNVSSETERMFREGVKAAQEGKRAEARNLLLRVTETDADNENAWLWLASISEYPEELLVFLNNVLRINPENERALEWNKATKSLLAKTLVQRGMDAVSDNRKDFARQCFEQALGHEAENEMAWLWLASVADSEEEKTACFEKVLSVNPANETAQMSLRLMESQKTQNLFQVALTAAFDGRHDEAKKTVETVLNRDSEMEDAWVLKSHIAGSFEERAECFLKLRALNPENEMARANLASWRMLADKVAEQPKAEESAEFAADRHEEAPAEFADYSPSDYSSDESFTESPAEPEFSAESETEQQAADFSEPETAYFEQAENHFEQFENVQPEFAAAENTNYEQFAQAENPTQDLSFDADYQQPEAMNFGEQEPEQNQFNAEQESFSEDFQTSEVRFEMEESQENAVQFSEPQKDLTAETEAEEAEMHWAFAGLQENNEAADYFRNSDESDDIHKTQQANYDAEDFAPLFAGEEQLESAENFAETNFETVSEQPTEEWRNTSPGVFMNYSPAAEENSFKEPTALFSATENPFVEEAPTAFYAAEVAAEPPMSFEENHSQAFAEEQVEEQVSMNAQETSEPQSEEAPSQPKAETILCPFCDAENEKQAFSCGACQTVLTLSDLEMILGQQTANQEKLQQSVESLERENESYGLSAEQMMNLGVGHINLKNYRQGFLYLQESVRLNQSNVLLDAQVNALAIRLSEMEEQQNAHDLMPKNRKILVVDDSPTVRKLISGKLEKCGHEVVCAIDGVDALEKINELKPDLVLLDITMPRMDGYQVCKLIRNNETTKDVPVVMISGKDGFFDKVRGRMAGTSGYITKPFGPETLMKTVETYLN